MLPYPPTSRIRVCTYRNPRILTFAFVALLLGCIYHAQWFGKQSEPPTIQNSLHRNARATSTHQEHTQLDTLEQQQDFRLEEEGEEEDDDDDFDDDDVDDDDDDDGDGFYAGHGANHVRNDVVPIDALANESAQHDAGHTHDDESDADPIPPAIKKDDPSTSEKQQSVVDTPADADHSGKQLDAKLDVESEKPENFGAHGDAIDPTPKEERPTTTEPDTVDASEKQQENGAHGDNLADQKQLESDKPADGDADLTTSAADKQADDVDNDPLVDGADSTANLAGTDSAAKDDTNAAWKQAVNGEAAKEGDAPNVDTAGKQNVLADDDEADSLVDKTDSEHGASDPDLVATTGKQEESGEKEPLAAPPADKEQTDEADSVDAGEKQGLADPNDQPADAKAVDKQQENDLQDDSDADSIDATIKQEDTETDKQPAAALVADKQEEEEADSIDAAAKQKTDTEEQPPAVAYIEKKQVDSAAKSDPANDDANDDDSVDSLSRQDVNNDAAANEVREKDLGDALAREDDALRASNDDDDKDDKDEKDDLKMPIVGKAAREPSGDYKKDQE